MTATTATLLNKGRSFELPSFADVVRSEWHKFHTVRSTYWSLLAAVVVGLGLSALISLASSNRRTAGYTVPLARPVTSITLRP